MKKYFLLSSFVLLISFSNAQVNQSGYEYAPNAVYPFGQMNPDAPQELADYAPLIGLCDCQSISRIDQNTWADTVDMTWTYRYILNGMGVQDETLKSDGKNGGSIRQFNADSARWYVHYYSTTGPTDKTRTWEGNKNEEGDIVLYRDSPAPSGTPGNYRITFSNISEEGFNWVGAWTNKDESIVYPTWRIFCKKRL